MNVLISLHKGYGLGDAVQMSAVLRHVVKAHPDWSIDYQAEPGKHCVGRGIVANTFAYGEPYPSARYDFEFLICLYDTYHGYIDRPNTRVSSCLQEVFGLPWVAELGRPVVNVSARATRKAREYLKHCRGLNWFVGVQTEGRSAKDKKNLSTMQNEMICDAVRRLGHTPFDFNNYSGDAEANCALIRQCEVFVGIDSGPGKCASATETPSLIVWTGHHPAVFHDPAPNTTHLVPQGYHSLPPVCNDPGVVAWFEANYNVRQYEGDPVGEIKKWLGEVLQ